MSKDQLGEAPAPTAGTGSRRDFLRRAGLIAGGAQLVVRTAGITAFLSSCSDADSVAPPIDTDLGVIEGVIVDAAGAIQKSLGTVYLMSGGGLQTGRSATVDAAGMFEFRDVAPGDWQLRFQAPRRAYIPEQYPHPVRVHVAPKFTVSLRIIVEVTELADDMIEIYAGDDFFQQQPDGRQNGETVVRVGTPVCWYNVGNMVHTVTGGPWVDSGDLQKTGSFIWVAERPGLYAYRCRYHSPQMQATIRVIE